MATQMNWDLFSQHLADMGVKMNEMMKLVEEEARMTNGTQKNMVLLYELTKNVEKELSGLENESGRLKNIALSQETALGELKKEREETAFQNLTLQLEVDDLLKKMAIKDQELLFKKNLEMEELNDGLFPLWKTQSIFPSETYNDQEDLFSKLSMDCMVKIISLTSPRDACRVSLLGTTFKSAADSNAVWEEFIVGSDHMRDIMVQSMRLVPPALTAKDLFRRLADTPILFDNGTKSFSMDRRTGQKSYMLGAKSLHIGGVDKPAGSWRFIRLGESRFPKVVELNSISWLGICGKISKKLLSRNTLYEAYLVYNLTPDSYGFENEPIEVSWGCGEDGVYSIQTIFLDHSFINNLMEVEPEERSDGWMEIKMGDYFNGDGDDTNGYLHLEIMELNGGHHKGGLIVEGIDIRAIIE